MKVGVFSTYAESGGAGIAANRLVHALLSQNIKTDFFVKKAKSDYPTILMSDPHLQGIEKLVNQNYIDNNRTPLSNTHFSVSLASSVLPDLNEYDLINLHWIEHFLSLDNLKSIVNLNKPIVWTLHDMKPLTGGCHYNSQCDGYVGDCVNCKQIINDPCNLISEVLSYKKDIFNRANLTIVCPSHWMAQQARESSLFCDKRIEVIPNSVNTDVYSPDDREASRRYFGINNNQFVLLFGAHDNDEKRKGFEFLEQSLKKLLERVKPDKISAIIFGGGAKGDFPIQTKNIGHIESEVEMAKVYRAADAFILPSLEDNLPNSLLESLSCGVPVIAFDVGGVKDIVDNSNGILISKEDSNSLADAIIELMSDSDITNKKSRKGRSDILNKLRMEHQGKKYSDLFEELINQPFNYSNVSIDLESVFDQSIGYIARKNRQKNKEIFFDGYVSIIEQLKRIEQKEYKVLVYGYGTISTLIASLIPENIVAYVDINKKNIENEKVYLPEEIPNFSYDKIIISVLGREEGIIEYLTTVCDVLEENIITLSI